MELIVDPAQILTNSKFTYVGGRHTTHQNTHTHTHAHHSFIHSFTHSFRSVVHQIRSLFQTEFSAECDLALLLQISSIYSLRSPSSCIRLLPLLPVPFIFPSVTCYRRQFHRKMCPIQLAFLLFIVRRMYLSS